MTRMGRILLVLACCAPLAARGFEFYEAGPETSRTNQMGMFVELWNATLEHQLAINDITNYAQASIVHDYPVYAGTTSSVFAVTNVSAGVTNVLALTNYYKSFVSVRRTNQFKTWTYETNSVVTVNEPWVWAEDIINLHARIWSLISGQNASFVDHTRAATNNVLFATNASVLVNSFPVTATGLFQRLGVGVVTNTWNGGAQTNWSVSFTGFKPAPAGGAQMLYEAVNMEEYWTFVLSGFTNEALNGTYSYDGVEQDSYEFFYHVWRNGAATILAFASSSNEVPGAEAPQLMEPYLILGSLDSWGEPYWYAGQFGEGPWVGSDGSTGEGTRTNMTFAFQRQRWLPAPEVQGDNLKTEVWYKSASTTEPAAVTLTIQGSAKLTNKITHNVEEVLAVSAAPSSTNALTLQWLSVTNVVVTGDGNGYDLFSIVYPQPVSQGWASYPTKIEYWMYNEFALVLNALRWTCLANLRWTNATWNGGSGLGCTWEDAVAAAEADDNNAFTNSTVQFSAPRIATYGEPWSGECPTGIMLRATWQTISSSAVLTNLATNLSKTVDTYMDVGAVGIFDANGTGYSNGYFRAATTDAGFLAGVSNVLGDVSHQPGNWQYYTADGTNGRGFDSVSRWQAVVKWEFSHTISD